MQVPASMHAPYTTPSTRSSNALRKAASSCAPRTSPSTNTASTSTTATSTGGNGTGMKAPSSKAKETSHGTRCSAFQGISMIRDQHAFVTQNVATNRPILNCCHDNVTSNQNMALFHGWLTGVYLMSFFVLFFSYD